MNCELKDSRKVKFSVVIPLYNKAAHIASTLASVVSQSYEDFEVCVINDGSTDDSAVQASLISDPRIRIITQINGGVSAARNRGIKEAVGDYIAFLDADDYWYPFHLEELNSLIENYPEYGIYSVAHEILRQGSLYLPSQPFSTDFFGPVENFFVAFSKSLALVNSTTACVSRNSLIKLGGFPVDVKKGEDVYVWVKAALNGGLVYSARVCARYNQDAQFRSNHSISSEIPYYLVWLDDLVSASKLQGRKRIAAQQFIQTGAFYNAAGYRLDGNSNAFENIKKLKASRSFKMRVYLAALEFTPVALLKMAQAYRHSRVRES